ncbi:MAG: hypothetical protein ACSLFH_12500 [Desulfuromonadales bacterium]
MTIRLADSFNKEIIIREPCGLDRVSEWVRAAVPCARGELRACAPLVILDPNGRPLPIQIRVLKEWPDRSIKWLLADFAVDLPANGETKFHLAAAADSVPVHPYQVVVTPGEEIWTVDTGAGKFDLDARIYRPCKSVHCEGVDTLTEDTTCLLREQTGMEALPIVEEVSLEDDSRLHAIVRMTGHFTSPAGNDLRFASRLHFFAGCMTVKVEFTLHNPRSAIHPQGLWDLGGPGSVLFKELVFTFPLSANDQVHCAVEPSLPFIVVPAGAGFKLYQESSGGENWQSPVHRNREGRVPHSRRGYVVEVDGRESTEGLRATPLVWCGNAGKGVAVALPRFWQEFPKGIEVADGKLRIALFPADFPGLHELQGGEQKTCFFWIDFTAEKDALAWALDPVQVVASPATYRRSGVLSDLPGDDDLVDSFASSTDIITKREIVDEYGWRHFGEVYADHEAVNHQGDEVFVSHYNNQYDFLAGAYRKAFTTKDAGWYKIAAELADHVRDIDIYHTDRDREEYNHGLFWHTDHYADAGLSTHRAYSREQKAAYQMHSGGGGPGAEHCYTTGLVLHYFQTGNPDFKKMVIDLAEWELLSLTGPQTLLAALKRGVGYLNLWRSSRGNRQLFPRYPLTRGTGNAITACLDAFEVGGGRRFLVRAEELIQHTIHPGDDLGCRELLNTEVAWSYTVLLVALAKYLDKKFELEEFDTAFAYARASLLAYTEWMVIHEYPYLAKPEVLEYPNETWVTQDLRKSVVFCQAARYAENEEQKVVFMERASFFYNYVREELPKHNSSSFSRPLALMLQNGWVGDRLTNEVKLANFPPMQSTNGRPAPYLSLGSVIERTGSEIVKVFGQTSVKREMAWLRVRLKTRA